MAKAIKTNVIRHLTAAGVKFETKEYPVSEDHLDGVTIARETGMDPDMVYKTLVLCDDARGHLVCVIPVARELDLKQVARATGHKSVSMLPMKDLLPLTGYVRGGCSPIGMKKAFPTFIDEACLSLDTMAVSAGIRGCQVLLSPQDLIAQCGARTASLCREEI
ncbi:MAG: Cys-tRNA(Pro) deacylase [Clostridia bacterium]|nr:Cys-tRNA(Pro) deacylase [Clostridia bacterium]